MAAEKKRFVKINNKTTHQRLQQDQKRYGHLRQHQRHNCFIISSMNMLDRSLVIDGVIKEISSGGCLFRPASTFLLYRSNDRISLEIGDIRLTAKIIHTKPIGYGIQFLDNISEEMVEQLLQDYSTL